MKIRTDFVTNSSSSSFMLVIRIGLKNGNVLKFMGDGGVGEGMEDYAELTVNESPEALGKCESIDDLIKMLQRSVVEGSDTYYDEGEEPEYPVLDDREPIIDGLRKLNSMDEIETITINGDLFGRGEQYQYKHYTYYRDKKETVYDEGGDEYINDEGTGGRIGFDTPSSFYTPDSWKKAEGFGETAIEEFEYFDEDVAFPGEKKKRSKKETSGYYSITTDGVLRQYQGKDKKIIVPAGVERIGSCAFKNGKMTSIVVPEGVKYIGSYAFFGCNYLEELTLPSSIEEFSESALEGCDLQRIIAPQNVLNLINHIEGIFDNGLELISKLPGNTDEA